MEDIATITINLLSYWQCSAGETGSEDVDQVVVKDKNGLPYIPAKTLKGLFRDALTLLQRLEQGSSLDVNALLGSRETKDAGENHRYDSREGRIGFDNAILPADFRNWAESRGGEFCHEIAGLYDRLSRTALEKGIAKNNSLRTDQVTIPLDLTATVHLSSGGYLKEGEIDSLKRAALIIRKMGMNRHRGLGRCKMVFTTLETASV